MVEPHRSRLGRVLFGAAFSATAAIVAIAVGAANGPSAAFSCPATGTVFTMSLPLAVSPKPGFRDHVVIAGHRGYDCRILRDGADYWLHAGLVESNTPVEWRAAAEELWPLEVGKKSHANFRQGSKFWAIDYEVVAYEKVAARIGTYDAFKIVARLSVDGYPLWTSTVWWSPALKYVLSYRLVHAQGYRDDDEAYEVASVGSGET